ncbi:TlpA disulfide reductase family protein [Chryseobacterium sp.]|uniref:TlpA family protein disulfide reductase n=1 Tax=Chryseobacterium sp. TaxID=1871047 RepID=UPI00321A5D72
MKLKLILLSFIFFAGINHSFALEDGITIKIEAKNLAKEKVNIALPYLKEKITLDSNGKGQIKIPFKNKTFAILSFQKGQTSGYNILYLDKGYNLSIKIKKSAFCFKGEGSKVNLFISNCNNYIELRERKIQQMYDQNRPINEIVLSYLKLDTEFEQYYSLKKKELGVDPETDYLLYNNFLSMLLGRKQQMISLLPIKEADSLNLVEKLGIYLNPLFGDSILVKAGSINFKNFLIWNNDFNLARDVPFAVIGAEKYPGVVGEYISSKTMYSEINREHLMFANLVYCMSNFGYTKEIEILTEEFLIRFPNSLYKNAVSELKNRFDSLTKGKPAPEWILESSIGKKYSLSELKGKVIFIDVWATWCIPCIRVMPEILEFQKQYNNIVFLFVSIDKDVTQWKKFLNLHPENNGINLNTENSNFEQLYRVTGVPRQILIDKDGNIIDAFVKHDELKQLLESYSK